LGALTEREIFSCMTENLAEAAERCAQLAWHPLRGFVYIQFRKNLKLAEGACRQAAAHREDARWLPIALQLGELHKRCGAWLRSSPTTDTRNQVHPLFKKTAEILLALARQAEDVRDKATNSIGIILPKPLPGPHRDTRPIQVLTPGGLVLPPTMH
jgi:hypothetical protein